MPQFGRLLLSIVVLTAALVCLGLVASLQALVRSVGGFFVHVLGLIPAVGDVLANPVNSVVQWMDHELGSVTLALDNVVGHYFHALGSLVQWIGTEIKGLATTLFQTIETLALLAPKWLIRQVETRLRQAVRWVTSHAEAYATRIYHLALRGAEALVAPALRGVHAIWGAIRNLYRGLLHAIESKVRWFSRAWRGLWHAVHTLERWFSRKHLHAIFHSLLRDFGLLWITGRNLVRWGKAMLHADWRFIEGLARDLESIDGPQSVQEFTHAMISVEDKLIDGLSVLCTELGAVYLAPGPLPPPGGTITYGPGTGAA